MVQHRTLAYPRYLSLTPLMPSRYVHLLVLDGLLGEKLLNLLVDLEKLERWLDNAIEQEREVHQEHKPDDLKPFEALPAQP